jgi:hypothetical protein
MLGTDIAGKVRDIRSKAGEIKRLYPDIEQSFKDTEQHLKDAKLPQEIMNREKEAVAQYESRKAAFEGLMGRVDQATDSNNSIDQQTALADLGSFMAKYPSEKQHQYIDPNKLPFSTPNSKVRAPNVSKAQYQASLFPQKYEKVMLAGPIPDGLQLAQAILPEIQTAPDLAETEDVQITQAIRDQAAQLNNNPVKIYNWVRNNIAFIPSYGSIQGSDMTLQNKRGNAFDTASLLIALYRAAGIPARYVYGTIEVPADKVMNWVGGVTKAEAAQSLLGQGGIPNIGITSGGVVKTIRMEHVWVEAYVDYIPSRGAINKTPTTWVSVDASFKQYQFKKGLDLKANIILNAQGLIDQANADILVNQTENSVANLNQNNLQTQLTDINNKLQTYIQSQNASPTVGDVLGTQKIIDDNHSTLIGTLPYRAIAIGSTFQSLPDSLRHKFQYNLYASESQRAAGDNTFSYQQSLPQLSGKKVTLNFAPASQIDSDALSSYVPKSHSDGTSVQPSEFPSTLPAYLIHVKAQLKVDDVVVAEGGAFTLGTELIGEGGFTQYDFSAWDMSSDYTLIAGQTSAVGLSLQGVTSDQLRALSVRLQQANAKIAANDMSGLSGEAIVGDMLTATIWSYFSSLQNFGRAASQQNNLISLPGLSYGLFHTLVTPNNFFGITTNVKFPGFLMDVGHLRHCRVAQNNDTQVWIAFNRVAGLQASAFEHIIPEAFFNDRANPQFEGASAAKVLGAAAAEGQKIYVVTQANFASVLPQLAHSSSVMSEVENAIAVGREVTIAERPVRIGGFNLSGYIVMDVATGAGAYMIAGGANGGTLGAIGDNSDAIGFAFFVLGLLAAAFAGPVISIVVGIVAIVIGALAIASAELDAFDRAECPAALPCIRRIFLTVFWANFMLAGAGFFVNPLAALAVGIQGLIWGDNVAKAASNGCNSLACVKDIP